jgi:hypothetical protein
MSTFGASGGGVLVASVLDWLDPLLAAAGTAPTADPGTK